MKVLIINPPWPGKGFGTRSQNRIIKQRSDMFLQYPIFLAYSAAQLKASGHTIAYIDSVIQDLNMDQTLVQARQAKPEVIFMETTTPSIDADYDNLAALKDATGARIIVGGPHATHFHKTVMEECPAIDVVIRHEFDTKMATVVSNLANLDEIGGITYRRDEEIMDNGDGEMEEDLDRIPLPDRDVIPWKWYREAWLTRQPFMNMMTSRGCPYHCSFGLWPQCMYGQ